MNATGISYINAQEERAAREERIAFRKKQFAERVAAREAEAGQELACK